MKLIQKLMGRRQFLIAAGVTSGCALTYKKITGFMDKGGQAGIASAAEKSGGIDPSSKQLTHLLSPLKIRNVVLKNRIFHTPSPPHCLQGPENYPTDAFRNHYSNMAKNAAIVTVDMLWGDYPKTYSDPPRGADYFGDHNWQDIPPVHNYIQRMLEDIHAEGALAHYIGSVGGSGGRSSQSLEEVVENAKEIEDMGFDVMLVSGNDLEQVEAIRNATNLLLIAKLSVGGGMSMGSGGGGQGGGGGAPQGQGGGQMPQGQGGGQMPQGQGEPPQGGGGEMPQGDQGGSTFSPQAQGGMGGPGGGTTTDAKWNYPGIQYDWDFGERTPGLTNVNQPSEEAIKNAVESAKKLEGMADIFWIRDGRHEHPNSFIQDEDRPFNLAYAKAIKEAGVDAIICPTAGFHNVLQNEAFIAGGETDMVGMTTPFFADAEHIKKASEGRFDDIVPCLQCHDCHGLGRGGIGPFFSTCNVNPEWGAPMYKLKNIPAPTVKKKVAVIGGGPGGMKAAMVAAERGHAVTLYEKSDALGGLLKFTDHTRWKWTYRDFKNHLVHQVNKMGIDVKLKTAATPEMIKKKGYDTVLVATGAEPIVSRMPGADGSNVFDILTAHSNKDALGEKVVMIGAGRIGTEAAIGMAKDGHDVTVMTTGSLLIELEVIGPHNMMNQIAILQNHPKFHCILEAIPKKFSGKKVYYTDSDGKEQTIDADSVVLYNGLKPTRDEASKFAGAARQVLLLGDCTGKNGTIQKTMRSAYFMASQV
jgi:thioredoxin reductase